MSSDTKKLYFEPYARLLTMLSEQLIKNEVVALTAIVKNGGSKGFENYN